MVRLYAISGMMVLSMAATCAAQVETFTWEEGRFTIFFADKPKVGQQVIKLPVGDVTMHIFTAEFPKKTGEMVVSYADYPAQTLATRKADEMLDDSVTGTIKGMKATLVKSDRITQAGSPGRKFSWTAAGPKGQLKGQGRIFLVGPRLYQVLIVGTEKSLQLDVYDMIFESFEFKPAPGATATAKTKPATPGTKKAARGAMTKATTPAQALGTARGKATAKARDRWITHTGVSFEGLWNVQMPTKPKHTTEPGLFGVKVRNVHVVSDGKLTYTLKIQVTPDEALDEGKESVLAAARDKLAEEVGGKVVEESDAQIAGYEGHAYRLDVPGPKPAVVAARAAIVGKRTVVLYVSGDRAAAAGPSAERFLDSFQVDK
jgi:hypothetical protein